MIWASQWKLEKNPKTSGEPNEGLKQSFSDYGNPEATLIIFLIEMMTFRSFFSFVNFLVTT